VLDTVYDPAVVAVAVYAMHGQGNKIPDDIQFPYLYDLAVLCEDYRYASTMMPWCQNWIEKWRWAIEKPSYGGWLYIAWVFAVTKRLSRGAFREGNGRFVTLENKEQTLELGEYIPQMIIGALTLF